MRERLAVTPAQYRRVAYAALAALTVIVLTGAAVRLTDSGLGCSSWPKCSGNAYPPLQTHALIEFGNRMVGVIVGIVCAAVVVLSYTRRPYRRDLMLLSWVLPLGVVAQAVLGGLTVRGKLAPGWVIAHFLLSMLILVAAVALAWRATHEPGARARSSDRVMVWSVRALLPLGAIALAAGTVTTAAGPHSGGTGGEKITRLTFKGSDTLQWMVHRHATIAALFGIAVIAVWLLRRQRGGALDPLDPLTVLGVLLAAQGLVGSVQYELHLPTDIVWVHVGLATLTWLTVLWAVADAGVLVPRAQPAAALDSEPPERGASRTLEPVG
jgi:cytochrome c oxidase assembly protein subunit 15